MLTPLVRVVPPCDTLSLSANARQLARLSDVEWMNNMVDPIV